jgi:hypothetical protein
LFLQPHYLKNTTLLFCTSSIFKKFFWKKNKKKFKNFPLKKKPKKPLTSLKN